MSSGTPIYRSMIEPPTPNNIGRKTRMPEYDCLVKHRGLWREALYDHTETVDKPDTVDLIHYAKLCVAELEQPKEPIMMFADEEFTPINPLHFRRKEING